MTFGFVGYREKNMLMDIKNKYRIRYLFFINQMVSILSQKYTNFVIAEGNGVYKDVKRAVLKVQKKNSAVTLQICKNEFSEVLINKCDFILVLKRAYENDYVSGYMELLDGAKKLYDVCFFEWFCGSNKKIEKNLKRKRRRLARSMFSVNDIRFLESVDVKF